MHSLDRRGSQGLEEQGPLPRPKAPLGTRSPAMALSALEWSGFLWGGGDRVKVGEPGGSRGGRGSQIHVLNRAQEHNPKGSGPWSHLRWSTSWVQAPAHTGETAMAMG